MLYNYNNIYISNYREIKVKISTIFNIKLKLLIINNCFNKYIKLSFNLI